VLTTCWQIAADRISSGPSVPDQTSKSLSRRAALYVAAICVAILGLEGWREWGSYEAAVQRSISSNLNLAHSLRQHADDTFELAEQTVTAIVYEAQRAGEDGLAAIETRMRQSAGASSRILRIDIYDPEGKWLATTAQNLPPGPRQTGYSYFQNHRKSMSQAAFIGRPIQLPTGDWILTVSQRLNRADGSFGGVVVATIDCQYFSKFYSSFDVGEHGSISLATSSGILLARSPYDSRQIGRDLSKGVLFSQQLATRRTGDYEAVSSFDNVRRISTFDTSYRYPLVAVVAVSRDEVLAPWFAGALQRFAIAAALTVGLALLGLRLADQIGRRQHSERILAQKEAEFRLLAESASDLVERFDREGRRLYISPAMERLLGHKPHELLGTNAFETIYDEDRPSVVAATERLRSEQTTEETIVFRAQHRDGREIWLETALRITAPTDEQQHAGVVGITRDVTERKLLEMKLASLATIDGLTGLANRRAFDDALVREVTRSRRSHSPLSLLMIDCDRFKRFNDDYGHLAGDACLKAIAAVLMDRARRPLDVAARYGGEEMVLLLPDTELGAARAIGAEVCRQVQALGITHERNLPWKVATISVGVATLDASDGDTLDGPWLLSTADLALYDAKAQGRNQCVAPPLADTARLVG
jgi:diguanylate cyclase (GGDEF)-like protein/PAS domain S-box-containing protein